MFWRLASGEEVDVVVENGAKLSAFEINSGQTYSSEYLQDLAAFQRWFEPAQAQVIYGGEESFSIKNLGVCSWRKLPFLIR